MSLPEFASSARHPVAANTVDNILHALLPMRLSSKCDSVTMRTTAAPSHSSDSDSEPGGGMDSSSLVLESGDDDGTHDRLGDFRCRARGLPLGDDDLDACSFGDSEEEEVEAPEHPEPMPTLLTGLRRRSDIKPALENNDLDVRSFGGSEEGEAKAPEHPEPMPTLLTGLRRSSDIKLALKNNDLDACSFGGSEVEETDAPEHPEPMPTLLTGLRRSSDIKPALGNNDIDARSVGGSEEEEEAEAPKRPEPMPTLLTGLRRSSDIKLALGNNDLDACSFGDSEDEEVEAPKRPECMPTLLTGLRRSSYIKPVFGNNDLDARSVGGSEEGEAEAPKCPEPMPTLLTGLRRRSDTKTSQQDHPQRLEANCSGTDRHDVSTAWNCYKASVDSEDKASPDQDPLSYIRLLKPTDFVKFLKVHNVPVEHYGQGKARCIQDLWAEVVTGECKLQRLPRPTGLGKCLLQRSVKVLVLEVKATIKGKQRFLVLKEERNALGHIRHHLDYRVTKKVFDDEDIPAAIHRCLVQNLGLESGSVEEEFAIESAEDVEEVRESTAYPGLSTVYSLHLVSMRVRDISHPKMAAIGLPSGSTFTTRLMGSALGLDKWRTWCWCMPDAMEAARRSNQGRPTGQGRARPS